MPRRRRGGIAPRGGDGTGRAQGGGSKWLLEEVEAWLKHPVVDNRVVRVAGHIQDARLGPRPSEPPSQLAPAGTGHHDVRYQEMNPTFVRARRGECLLRTLGV